MLRWLNAEAQRLFDAVAAGPVFEQAPAGGQLAGLDQTHGRQQQQSISQVIAIECAEFGVADEPALDLAQFSHHVLVRPAGARGKIPCVVVFKEG